MDKLLKFPEGFLWGAATAGHQVEGNNIHSDWWAWEAAGKLKTKSGEAVDQYHKYEEDFDLAKKLNHDAHRLGIEWSRIEPEEGVFDQTEIAHYQKVLQSLKDKGLTVMLTLNHFTLPNWLANKGGWENFKAPAFFERFVKKVVPELKDYVDLWITINEPGVILYCGYMAAVWPPKKKGTLPIIKVYFNLARAHKKAYKTIHKLVPGAKVGIANNVSSFDVYHDHSLRENLARWLTDNFQNRLFYFLTGIKTHDFLGINYYFHNYINHQGKLGVPTFVDIATTKKETSAMGWQIHPEGMFSQLMDLSDFHKPIYITENGLAARDDAQRTRFINAYLKEIYYAIQAGANVRGYFHWSLIDNFEWADGFEPRFGLIEIDYKTQKRTPRPSALAYAEIIKNNALKVEINS